LSGLAPGLQATRLDLASAMKGRHSRSARSSRLPRILIVTQVATCLIVLITGGLFLRSLQWARAADVGFDARNLLVASIDLPQSDYNGTRITGFYARLRKRIARVPGVHFVSLAETFPL